LSTKLTVVWETPAARATSVLVMRFAGRVMALSSAGERRSYRLLLE
jgi:hypothetical protein